MIANEAEISVDVCHFPGKECGVGICMYPPCFKLILKTFHVNGYVIESCDVAIGI